jgi:hypothetical protein
VVLQAGGARECPHARLALALARVGVARVGHGAHLVAAAPPAAGADVSEAVLALRARPPDVLRLAQALPGLGVAVAAVGAVLAAVAR